MTTRHRLALVAAVMLAAGCSSRPVLIENARARALSASLHVNFTKATEAVNLAVMADTDEASAAAATEARSASDAAQKDLETLRTLLDQLGYSSEAEQLRQFATRFDEARRLDAEILPLAVENSNLKAQRLAFQDGQQAADGFAAALRQAAAGQPADVQLSAARAEAAVLRIQVLQSRHIAESSDEKMTAIEAQMADAGRTATEMLTRLARGVRSGSRDVSAARAALDRFTTINADIVRLSRRNSNVRSLALSLGRKRVVAAECEDHLNTLDGLLTAREFQGVR